MQHKKQQRLPYLPKKTRFIIGPGKYKYTALVPINNTIKKVNFGHREYQQYKDRVPKDMGGGLWKHKNHNDIQRKKNYRARHRGILLKSGIPSYKQKYTPSWFSYNFLW